MRLGKRWFPIIRRAVRLWLDHDALSHAGSLAFFTLFSLAPTLIVAVAVIGMVLGESAAQGEIVAQLADTMGAEAASAIEQAVLMSRIEATGLMPSLLGIGAVLVGATIRRLPENHVPDREGFSSAFKERRQEHS
jgi:membrane protein